MHTHTHTWQAPEVPPVHAAHAPVAPTLASASASAWPPPEAAEGQRYVPTGHRPACRARGKGVSAHAASAARAGPRAPLGRNAQQTLLDCWQGPYVNVQHGTHTQSTGCACPPAHEYPCGQRFPFTAELIGQYAARTSAARETAASRAQPTHTHTTAPPPLPPPPPPPRVRARSLPAGPVHATAGAVSPVQ